MGRHRRPHAPGMVFHLVSRLHRREPWFVPGLRDEVASLIRGMVGRTDADLLAYAVMPNHLHIVLRQGRAELAAVMQPLLRRIALRVQERHGFEGAVVERRYRDRLCLTPDYVREAILYVHLNPWRAGLCDDGLEFPWITHAAYVPGADPAALGIDPEAQRLALQLFAGGDRRTLDELCEDYLTWMRWRMWRDRVLSENGNAGTTDASAVLVEPDAGPGDRAWLRYFGHIARRGDGDARPGAELPDLRDYVLDQLALEGTGYSLEDLRGSWLPRPASRCRARVIRAAAQRGYRTCAIARLFGVSAATVSTAKHARHDDGG